MTVGKNWTRPDSFFLAPTWSTTTTTIAIRHTYKPEDQGFFFTGRCLEAGKKAVPWKTFVLQLIGLVISQAYFEGDLTFSSVSGQICVYILSWFSASLLTLGVWSHRLFLEDKEDSTYSTSSTACFQSTRYHDEVLWPDSSFLSAFFRWKTH